MQHADEDVEIMVLGNKIDLSNDRRISTVDGENFCRQNNFMFKEVTSTEP
jgi:GTPase SAR1 family protein